MQASGTTVTTPQEHERATGLVMTRVFDMALGPGFPAAAFQQGAASRHKDWPKLNAIKLTRLHSG